VIESGGIRLGFSYVDGLGEAGIARLEVARQAGTFRGLADFCQRSRLPRQLVKQLILAGAIAGWGAPRRQLLWELGQLRYREDELDLSFPTGAMDLPPLCWAEALTTEYEVLGLSTGDHVLELYRPWLTEQGILGSWELAGVPAGRQVRVAGLVVVHQAPPTAKGHHFITLEDEAGLIDVIIRPQVYAGYRRLWHTASLLIVEGTVQQQAGVTNLLALRAAAMPHLSDPRFG
jgi:error-prone DNA polymerase